MKKEDKDKDMNNAILLLLLQTQIRISIWQKNKHCKQERKVAGKAFD